MALQTERRATSYCWYACLPLVMRKYVCMCVKVRCDSVETLRASVRDFPDAPNKPSTPNTYKYTLMHTLIVALLNFFFPKAAEVKL